MHRETLAEYCGVGRWRPQWLQRFANVKAFTLFSAIVVTVQGTYLGYMIGILTTIERRFGFSSSASGSLLSIYDVGHSLAVLMIGHFGSSLHQPKWIGIGCMMSFVACMGLASPLVLFPDGKKDVGALNTSSTEMLPICLGSQNGFDPATCNGNSEQVDTGSKTAAFVVLAVFQMLAGVASCSFTTLTYVFVDNNSRRKDSPFLLGIISAMWIYGPAIGFLLAAGTAQLTENLGSLPDNISAQHPPITAWWLGLAVVALCYVIFGLPFFFYPEVVKRKFSYVRKLSLKPIDGSTKEGVRWFFKKMAELPVEILNLLRNRIFVCMALFFIANAYIVGGYFTFLPKYVEVNFKISPSKANIYTGVIVTVGAATATGVGSKLLSSFSPRVSTSMLLLLVGSVHFLITDVVLLFVKCAKAAVSMFANTNCLTDCACTMADVSLTVCDKAGTLYNSPCAAGCSTVNTAEWFSNCLCALGESVTSAGCQTPNGGSCSNPLIVYLIALFIGCSMAALFQMAAFTAVMWSVPIEKKPITIALLNFVSSCFGFIPSQIVYGALIDRACSKWSSVPLSQQTCRPTANQPSSSSYCLQYDTDSYRLNFHLSTIAFQVVACICLIVCWHFAKTFNFYEETGAELDGGEAKTSVELTTMAHRVRWPISGESVDDEEQRPLEVPLVDRDVGMVAGFC